MTDSIPGGTAPATPAPPPPPPPSHSPPLARSGTDRYIAGVCGGLGAHFGIAPVLFRIGFVALTFAGGLGFILYLAAWVLLPRAGTGAGPGRHGGWGGPTGMDPRSTRVLLYVLLALAALILFGSSLHVAHEGVLAGLALLAVGIFLLVYERQHSIAAAPSGAEASAPAAYAAGTFSTPAAVAPGAVWQPQGAPRQRSVLGLVTVAAALLTVGVVALLDTAGVVTVSVATCLAIVLMVVGAGLVAGAWFGRSRFLIVLGALLIPLTIASTLVDEPLTGGTGNVIVAPQGLVDLRGQYHLAAGQLTLDLSQIPLSSSAVVSVTVAFGKLTVIVPSQSNVVIAAHAGAGHLDLFGATDDGVNIDSPLTQAPSPGGGTLHLALSVGFGQIEVVDSASNPVPAQ